MSTSHTKTTLSDIFKYGHEALKNRRKDLFLISLYYIFLPQLAAAFALGTAAASTVSALADFQNLTPFLQFQSILVLFSNRIVISGLFAGAMGLLGILALARSSVDYFESYPGTLREVSLRSLRILLRKGLGSLFFFAILLPSLVVVPLIQSVALSMLVMLPVTLVTGSQGGFRTGWDTLFLRYANKTNFGRWPIFVNVLSVAGVFLTLYFGVSILIDHIAVADTLLEIPAGFLANTVHFGGLAVNGGHGLTWLLQIFWQCFAISTIIPFTAAIYHLSTVPEGHVSFEASV